MDSTPDREAALKGIAVGGIFHAEGSTGSSRVCLAMQVRPKTILARNIPTQAIYEFDRQTGIAVRYFSSQPVYYTIDSVARLPDDIHEIFLALDQKYREGEYRRAEDPNWESPPDWTALTEEQIRAHLFLSSFYRANPLPALAQPS